MTEYNATALEEYKEISIRLKEYWSMRYKHLMFYLVFTGGMMAFFLAENQESLMFLIGVPAVGVVLTLLFGAIGIRLNAYLDYYTESAKDLEDKINFSIYAKSPEDSLFSYKTIFKTTFTICLAVWVMLLLSFFFGG